MKRMHKNGMKIKKINSMNWESLSCLCFEWRGCRQRSYWKKKSFDIGLKNNKTEKWTMKEEEEFVILLFFVKFLKTSRMI